MSGSSVPTCGVIRPDATYRGRQGLDYGGAISAESVGAKALCMHFLEIPPGGRAKAHLHENHETAIYVLRGESGMWFGPRLEWHLVVKGGEFLYIPAGMPHLPYNRSATETCVAVIARTDPNEQESVVLLPELERAVDWSGRPDETRSPSREES
jgi:uncharacterized RmlC-like cupin family protein